MYTKIHPIITILVSLRQVKGYNETADWCYKNLIKNDSIAIYGNLNSEMEIIAQDIEFI